MNENNNKKGEKKTLEAILFTPFFIIVIITKLLYEIVYNVKEEIDGLMGIFICKLLVLINMKKTK